MKTLRIALAQINPTVGDFEGNRDKIISYIKKSRENHADLVVFPELAIAGYPPEDLLLRTDFISGNLQALKQIAGASVDIGVVVGFIEREQEIYNSSAFIYDGRIYGTYRKIFLPNYGVFDEKRYFSPGRETPIFKLGDVNFGVNICEDIWYPDGPASKQSVAGAGIILNLNASPYQYRKWKFREKMISTRAVDNACYIIYVNAVGGQDELIFEGGSLVFAPNGQMMARGKFFQEDLLLVDVEPELPFRTRLHDLRVRERINTPRESGFSPVYSIPVTHHREKKDQIQHRIEKQPKEEEEIYKALVLGTRDYILKNGFRKVVIGLSGGIDSALVACIAVDALGQENVTCLFMPSRYSSPISREDARQLAENLGVRFHEIPIDNLFQLYMEELSPLFKDMPEDVTEQNIQARIRGNYLMAFSNKFNSLVLTTGNKSEMAVGYATLYGDMAGGFAVIKDIPKTTVYKLAKYKNSISSPIIVSPPSDSGSGGSSALPCSSPSDSPSSFSVIPERIITRPPSAELKEDQKDTDNLPPYDIMDPILQMLVEEDREIKDIVDEGFDEKTVRKVARMLYLSEYKRRQAPPGVKITPRAFGRDRRVPITNKFKE